MRYLSKLGQARVVFSTLVGAALVAIFFVFGLAFWLSDAMNTLARENSVTLIDSALQSKFRRIGTLTSDYAHRDESFDVVNSRDDESALQVLGRGATLGSAFDFLLVTEADGTPIYGYRTGVTQSDISFIDPVTTAEYVATFGTGRTQSAAVLTGFTSVDGIVGLVAATRVLPNSATQIPPEEWPLLFGVLQLNDDRLKLVSGDMVVNEMGVLSPNDPTPIPESAARLPLLNKSGELISTLVWQPPRPGDALFRKSLPALITISCLLLLGCIFASFLTNRQSEAVQNAHQLARTDNLTGLLNSTGLDSIFGSPDLHQALLEGRVAALYLDLNGLKKVNDTLGHEAGNIALRVTAERLSESVRQSDFVARIGGDEFICIVVDDAPLQAAAHISSRIVSRTAPLVQFGEQAHPIVPSIGVALADGQIGWDALVSRADIAMYHAKRQQMLEPVYFSDNLADSRLDLGTEKFPRSA